MAVEQYRLDSGVGQKSGQKRQPDHVIGGDNDTHEWIVSRMVLARNRGESPSMGPRIVSPALITLDYPADLVTYAFRYGSIRAVTARPDACIAA
jgi:hypothetical protein